MSGFVLHTSPRMEDLIEALVRVTADPPSAGNAATNSVLIPEYIVVQSPGMERYLSLQLAARHGICANTRFFFPQNFMRELLAVRRGRPFPFDRDRLAWLVYALLPELVVDDRFVILRRYIRQQQTDKTTKTHRNDPENPASALRHMRLSRRIADLYDHYLIHRPEWLLAWQKGEPANIPLADDLFHQDVGQHVQWQSHLWKRIVQADSSFNFQHLLDDFKSHLSGAEGLAPGFPHRLIFLGVSALPELYRQLLSLLGRQVDIHMFNLIPTERITRNIRSGKAANDLLPFTERQSRTLLEFLGTIVASEKPQWNVSKSKTGRSGKSATDGGPADSGPGVAQESPGTHRTRLNSIQNAIIQNDLSASEREQTDRFAEDTSLVIQSCHSPLRELEVLHDWLLEQFRVRPDLHPDEIIVLTPDMETYAPLIEAVFRNPESDAHRITYTIADTAGSPEELEYRDTFFKMLELCSSRFPAGAVLQFCESAPVQRRFGFTQTELDALRLWIQRLNIRWGYNAATKSELGLPAEEANTWERGLHRLLLGYFIPNDRMDSDAAPPLFADLEPAPYMRGDNVALLERFAICLQTLENLSRNLRNVHRLGDWSTILHDAITGLLDDPDGRLGSHVRRALDDLHDYAAVTATEIPLNAVVDFLRNRLRRKTAGHGFMNGAVTFCEMLPMRSIPFRIIAHVGMHESGFPATERPAAFDLIARSPRPGDRLRRNEDRLLFLENLLSCREVLYFSYCGQSIRTGRPRAPSILIEELVELEQSLHGTPGELRRLPYFFEHRMHPFHPDYYTPGHRLYSYSHSNCVQVAEPPSTLSTPPIPSKRSPGTDARQPSTRSDTNVSEERQMSGDLIFVPENTYLEDHTELAQPSGCLSVSIADLKDFLRNPARHFLRNRPGLDFPPEQSVQVDENEAVKLNHLQRYVLIHRVCTLLMPTLTLDDSTSPTTTLRPAVPAGQNPAEIALNMLRINGAESQRERWHAILTATDLLPHGTAAELDMDACLHQSEHFLARIARLLGARIRIESRAGIPVQISIPQNSEKENSPLLELNGESNELRSHLFQLGIAYQRPARIRARDILTAWFMHLVRNILIPDKREKSVYATLEESSGGIFTYQKTYIVGRSDAYVLEPLPPARAAEHIRELCELFTNNLARPLCFFPESGFIYMRTLQEKKDDDVALQAARSVFYGNRNIPGERDDAHLSLCLRGHAPLQTEQGAFSITEFRTVSRRIFAPLLNALRTVEEAR